MARRHTISSPTTASSDPLQSKPPEARKCRRTTRDTVESELEQLRSSRIGFVRSESLRLNSPRSDNDRGDAARFTFIGQIQRAARKARTLRVIGRRSWWPNLKRDPDTDSVFSKSKAALPASLPTVDFSTRQGNSVNAPTKNPLPSFFDARRKNPSPIDHTLHNRVAKKDATGPFNPHKFGGEKKKKFQLHLWKPKEKPLASNDEVTIIEKDDNSSEQDDSFEEGDLDIIAEEDTQLCQEKKRKKKIQVIVTTVASVAVANAGIVAAIILL